VDPGGTDAARAARPHDSRDPNGIPPNQTPGLVPRHAAVCFKRRVHGTAPTERRNVTLDS